MRLAAHASLNAPLATLGAAVMHTHNVYYYLQGDLFDIAAAYAYHLAESQAFIDGHKRTGMASSSGSTRRRSRGPQMSFIGPCLGGGPAPLAHHDDDGELASKQAEDEVKLAEDGLSS